jgi:hypothetical protein
VETKVCTGCHISKDTGSFYRNKARYDGLNNYCKTCDSSRINKLRSKNPDRFSEVGNKSYQKHKNSVLKKQKTYREENVEKIRLKNSRYWVEDKERISKRNKAWKKSNPDKLTAMAAKRRAAELRATPPWLTQEMKTDINFFYTIRSSMKNPSDWHIDHITPLQGKFVSGLHIPSNLQLLPKTDNLSKTNKFTPLSINFK